MFEDQPAGNQPAPPANLPTEPEDIFAEVDDTKAVLGPPPIPASPVAQAPNALQAGLLKKKGPEAPPAIAPAATAAPTAAPLSAPPASPPPLAYSMREPILGKIILLAFFGCLLAGLGYSGWWVYKSFFKGAPVPAVPTGSQPAPAAGAITPSPPLPPPEPAGPAGSLPADADITAEMSSDQILFGEQVDTDRDGLDDIRERELGTSLNNSDTDSDGLGDGDEIIIWKTNPLNPDSDGDGYQDGEEVRNGYNPLGPGKLFNLPPKSATSTPSPAQ